MKYLSLIKYMHMYGNYIKSHKRLIVISHSETELPYVENVEYNPFIISSVSPLLKEQMGISPEQQMNCLKRNALNSVQYYNNTIPETFYMPPVLEIEWLRTKLDLSEENIEVLIQTSYFMVMNLMANYLYGSTLDWMASLENEGVIIDVEDLEDTPAILMNDSLSEIKVPKSYSYNMILIYAKNAHNLVDQCLKRVHVFKEVFLHLPIILSMFMVEYFENNLANWSSSTKIMMEENLGEILENYRPDVNALNPDMYTYGRCSLPTEKDKNLWKAVLNEIYNKLRDINRNMGLISYFDYKRITGPETTRASVRLSELDIDWDEEMARVEKEKKGEVMYS